MVRVKADIYDAAQCRLELCPGRASPWLRQQPPALVARLQGKIEIGPQNPTRPTGWSASRAGETHGRYNFLMAPSGREPVLRSRPQDPRPYGVRPAHVVGELVGTDAVEGGTFRTRARASSRLLASPDGCAGELDQWVGIDGAQDQDLIQAGIGESGTDPLTGQCTRGRLWFDAWWASCPGRPRLSPWPCTRATSSTSPSRAAPAVHADIRIEDKTTGQAFRHARRLRRAGDQRRISWRRPLSFPTPCASALWPAAVAGTYEPAGRSSRWTQSGSSRGDDTVSVPESVPTMSEAPGRQAFPLSTRREGRLVNDHRMGPARL